MTRTTYHYDQETGEMVEGPGPRRVDGHSGDGWRYSDRTYSASPFVTPDGTVIDSKKKHREYMKKNNLTTVDDFQGEWKNRAKERESFFTGGDKRESEQRKRDIVDAINRRTSRG